MRSLRFALGTLIASGILAAALLTGVSVFGSSGAG